MAKKIDTDANISRIRLAHQTSHPSAPASGFGYLYLITGSANGGFVVEDPSGNKYTFLTGTSNNNLVLLEKHTASATGSASLIFNNFLSPLYDIYQIEIVNVHPKTNNVDFYMQFSTGSSSWDTGNNYVSNLYLQATSGNTSVVSTTSQFSIRSSGEVTNASGKDIFGTLKLYNPGGSSQKQMGGQIIWHNAGGGIIDLANYWYFPTNIINGIKFYFSSGDIDYGTIRIYGIPNG